MAQPWKCRFICFLLLCFYVVGIDSKEYEPITVYLTWQRNPSTTMTVHWITPINRTDDLVQYQKVGESEWQSMVGAHVPMPERFPYFIHHVELTGLDPQTDYRFRIGEGGAAYKFRTMPHKIRGGLRFAVGGDFYHDGIELVNKMNAQVAKLNPSFILCGGDLAYYKGKVGVMPRIMPRWMDWLISWKNTMVTTDGRLIPLVPVIGNHDLDNKYSRSQSNASYFHALFSMPGIRGYNILDFGSYMTILLLDSGHTQPISGFQSQWLNSVLSERKDIPYKFALYHVPAYPSVRPYDGLEQKEIRSSWVPLFEKYNLLAAFENHDHAYKRTHPILKGKKDEAGVVYLGDGGWGVKSPRTPKDPKTTWYLAKSAPSRNAIIVTIKDKVLYYTAIDDEGKIIDEYMQKKEISQHNEIKSNEQAAVQDAVPVGGI